MSSNGQDLPVAAMPRALVVDLAPGDQFEWHAHEDHQLALASRGVLILAVDSRKWVLPRSRGLWIPAGVRHAVTASVDTTMISLYVDPARCRVRFDGPTVIDAEGLLGELASHLGRAELTPAERTRAEAVLWDLLTPLPVVALPLPMPVDDRATRVAQLLMEDVTDPRTLEEWGRAVGASARTLARIFVTETGMGFAQWRTNARLAAALPILAAGRDIAAAAHEVGYSTPSAFVAAFHREIGTTPAKYFRSG